MCACAGLGVWSAEWVVLYVCFLLSTMLCFLRVNVFVGCLLTCDWRVLFCIVAGVCGRFCVLVV